jgi:threonine dehydratase
MTHPTLDQIREAHARIRDRINLTPVWRWRTGIIEQAFPGQTEIWLKLELLQITGTFKLRGALMNLSALSPQALRRGVTAVSAGNHAIAVAYAARASGATAKVVMMQTSSPARVQLCKDMGAEVILAPNVHEAFETVKRIEQDEGRTFIHPFEGELTALGTATLGLELCSQLPNLDVVIVPIGGGGLCAGIATAVKQLNPNCKVIGVEPEGADSMSRSLSSGKPETLEAVRTVADSLGAPYALPYSFGLVQQFVDEVVRVSDDALCEAMFYLFGDMKLAVEPACAAATAAALGPLRETLTGKRVCLIACGSNIDSARFTELLSRGAALARQNLTGWPEKL